MVGIMCGMEPLGGARNDLTTDVHKKKTLASSLALNDMYLPVPSWSVSWWFCFDKLGDAFVAPFLKDSADKVTTHPLQLVDRGRLLHLESGGGLRPTKEGTGIKLCCHKTNVTRPVKRCQCLAKMLRYGRPLFLGLKNESFPPQSSFMLRKTKKQWRGENTW